MDINSNFVIKMGYLLKLSRFYKKTVYLFGICKSHDSKTNSKQLGRILSKSFWLFFRRLNNQADVEELTSLVLTKFINKISNQNTTLENPHGYLWKIARSSLADFINHKVKQPTTLSLDDNLDTITEDLDKYRSDHFKQKNSRFDGMCATKPERK
jgi:DNA-directed RNA polymerase specialized sigma24 family protein